MSAEVVVLQKSSFRDTVTTLRLIADGIERGDYGEVSEVALVLFGDTVEVFGFGPTSDAASTALLLQAGALRLTTAVERHGRDGEK